MIYCESPTLERWIAPPQEDLPRPTWTKLIAGSFLISNSLEFADWVARPVQPIVCEKCWAACCSLAGLANIVRLGDQLLWLPPRFYDDTHLNEVNFIRETVLMPVATWERLRENSPNLPPATSYARATRGDIASLWLHELPEEARIREIEDIDSWLRTALASDPVDPDPARQIVNSLVDWLCTDPERIVEGRMAQTLVCGDAVNTFFFDGYEWPSFVVGRDHTLACGAEWAFIGDAPP